MHTCRLDLPHPLALAVPGTHRRMAVAAPRDVQTSHRTEARLCPSVSGAPGQVPGPMNTWSQVSGGGSRIGTQIDGQLVPCLGETLEEQRLANRGENRGEDGVEAVCWSPVPSSSSFEGRSPLFAIFPCAAHAFPSFDCYNGISVMYEQGLLVMTLLSKNWNFLMR